jgi:hypothetical protein
MVAAPVRIADPAPPPPADPGVAQPTAPPINPYTEVVAAWGPALGGQLATWARALPWAADDLSRDFPDVYTQMGHDPQIHATTMVLLKAALNAPPILQPGAPEGHSDYTAAQVVTAFSQRNLDGLPTPIIQTLYELGYKSLQHGHGAAEQVYRLATWDAAVGPQIVLDRLKPKPRRAYVWVQDAYGNCLGALPRRPGQVFVTTGLYANGLVGSQPLIPLRKMPPLTHNPQDGDVRGQSAWRPAYNAWYMTQQALPELLSLVARFGQPTVKLTNAPGAGQITQTDPETGLPISPKQAQQDLLDAGVRWRAGGVIALAAGQTAELTEAQTEGQIFFNLLTLFAGMISRAILGQTLATNEGSHRSGTDSKTHQDILAIVVRYAKAWLADWLRIWVIAPLVEYNYGIDALRYCPLVSLGQTDPHDQASVLNSISQLCGAKFYGPDGPTLDERKQLQAYGGLPISPSTTPAPARAVPAPIPATEVPTHAG